MRHNHSPCQLVEVSTFAIKEDIPRSPPMRSLPCYVNESVLSEHHKTENIASATPFLQTIIIDCSPWWRYKTLLFITDNRPNLP